MQTFVETCVVFDAAHLSINLLRRLLYHLVELTPLRHSSGPAVGESEGFIHV